MTSNEEDKLRALLKLADFENEAKSVQLSTDFASTTARLAIAEALLSRSRNVALARVEYLGMHIAFAAAVVMAIFVLPQLSDSSVNNIALMFSAQDEVQGSEKELIGETTDLEEVLWSPI